MKRSFSKMSMIYRYYLIAIILLDFYTRSQDRLVPPLIN